MKKKFNAKLTAMLVSLFIGLFLIILGNKNQYCLSFGFIIIGADLIIYTLDRVKNLNELINSVNKEIDELEDIDFDVLDELYSLKKKFKKQRNFGCTIFFVFSILLVTLGFVGLF